MLTQKQAERSEAHENLDTSQPNGTEAAADIFSRTPTIRR